MCAWLKLPLGKPNTERMVPGRPDHGYRRSHRRRPPITAADTSHHAPAEPRSFLLTRHGRRITVDMLRDVITRVARDNNLPHTPHQ
jgi:hypothetical protein